MPVTDIPKDAVRPSFLRRLGAFVYDTLLVIPLLMLATVPTLAIDDFEARRALHLPFLLWILLVTAAYFVWNWTRSGQTLGMKAWRLRLLSDEGGAVPSANAIKRFFAAILAWAPLGAGVLWMYIDPNGSTLQGRLSSTRVVVMRKPAKSGG
jgi:uncharacterized RDD family membrane protein YckC